MTARKTPQTTAPSGAVAPSPLTPEAAQGDRPSSPSIPRAAARGPKSPAVEVATSSPAPTAGPGVPGAAVAEAGEGQECGTRPLGSTAPLSGKAFRDALKAAQSAKAKARRQQRARPWASRDRYARAVPGGRKPPPKDVA